MKRVKRRGVRSTSRALPSTTNSATAWSTVDWYMVMDIFPNEMPQYNTGNAYWSIQERTTILGSTAFLFYPRPFLLMAMAAICFLVRTLPELTERYFPLCFPRVILVYLGIVTSSEIYVSITVAPVRASFDIRRHGLMFGGIPGRFLTG